LGLPPEASFEAVARDWLATIHESKVSAGHAERTRIRREQDVFPWIGRKPIAEVTAPDVLACLRRVEARGAIETAHRIKAACGQVFR
ncbi:phage integrase central domain-containing protein, partial [Stenotrophomonas maltophilia]|uniref:phage integrase central domain-containing protein n=1 Tax=Stenotrophomonas maltophilia TaxID=40324 RepID=UPI003CCFE6BA